MSYINTVRSLITITGIVVLVGCVSHSWALRPIEEQHKGDQRLRDQERLPFDRLGSLLIHPIGFRVQDDQILVDLLIEGPADSTLAAAETIANHVVRDPAIWLEVENLAREPLHLTSFVDKHARINMRATDHARTVVLEAKQLMRTVVTVVAKTSEELAEDTSFHFRLSPNAPYQQRLDAIGTAPGIHQVVADTAWYRTLSPWK